jgi:hypothetical protein
VRTIVARAIDRGELPETSDVELLSVLPLAVLQHLSLEFERRPDEAVVERIVDQFYTPASARDPRTMGKEREDSQSRA